MNLRLLIGVIIGLSVLLSTLLWWWRLREPSAQPPILLIIQGGYRTLDLTIDSILRNLCSDQRCHVALSLANNEAVVSAEVKTKLGVALVAEYYAEPGLDVMSPHYIFEYYQTLKVLERMPLDAYAWVARIRADCYLSARVPLLSALGEGVHFERDWAALAAHLLAHLPSASLADSKSRLRAWFFTCGGISRLVPKMVTQRPPPMAWSPLNNYDFNPALLAAIEAEPPFDVDDAQVAREVVRRLAREERVLYIFGGLFLHFGPRDLMVRATREAFAHWSRGPGVSLNWTFVAPEAAKGWRKHISQEANIRLTHRALGYALVDLHNAADYLVSFSWKYYGYAQLTRARGLVCWLLRERQVRFRWVPRLAARMWDPVDRVDYPNPTAAEDGIPPHGRPLILSHGCIIGATAEELADCHQAELE